MSLTTSCLAEYRPYVAFASVKVWSTLIGLVILGGHYGAHALEKSILFIDVVCRSVGPAQSQAAPGFASWVLLGFVCSALLGASASINDYSNYLVDVPKTFALPTMPELLFYDENEKKEREKRSLAYLMAFPEKIKKNDKKIPKIQINENNIKKNPIIEKIHKLISDDKQTNQTANQTNQTEQTAATRSSYHPSMSWGAMNRVAYGDKNDMLNENKFIVAMQNKSTETAEPPPSGPCKVRNVETQLCPDGFLFLAGKCWQSRHHNISSPSCANLLLDSPSWSSARRAVFGVGSCGASYECLDRRPYFFPLNSRERVCPLGYFRFNHTLCASFTDDTATVGVPLPEHHPTSYLNVSRRSHLPAEQNPCQLQAAASDVAATLRGVSAQEIFEGICLTPTQLFEQVRSLRQGDELDTSLPPTGYSTTASGGWVANTGATRSFGDADLCKGLEVTWPPSSLLAWLVSCDFA